MDTFDLDTIREAFEADVTRYVAQARASVQRCLGALPDESGWSATAAGLQRLLASPPDRGDDDWRLLATSVDAAAASEDLTRRILLHVDSACAGTMVLLQLELTGRRAEALRRGSQQAAETEHLLEEVRSFLRGEARPAEPRGAARSTAGGMADGGKLLQRVGERVEAPFVNDADLQEIEHCCHTVRGSSGMVSLLSLSECANKLEMLIARCREIATAHVAIVLALARAGARLAGTVDTQAEAAPPSASAESSSRVSALETALSFGGEEPEAASVADAAPAPEPAAEDFGDDLFESPSLAELPPVSAAPEAGAPAAPEDPSQAFEFGEEPAAGTAEAAAPSLAGVDAELLEIFIEEARQCLGDLRRSFARVTDSLSDCNAWLDLSRHFHLLKGSAGTVGVTALARIAAELEDRAEAFGEKKRAATAQDLASMRAEAARMLASCRIELDEPAPAAAAAAPVSDELAAVFTEEARSILGEAESILADEKATHGLGESDRMALAALLHRLKGSALLQGSEKIGGLAASLHDLCDVESLTEDAHRRLAAGLEELRGIVGGGNSVAASAAREEGTLVSVTIEAEPAVWEAFQIEVQEFVEQLDRIALELEGAEQPRRRLDDAFRCLHTLKGACNTVGLSPTGAMLHEVESYFEHLQRMEVLPPLAGIVRLMLDALDAVKRDLKHAVQGAVTDNVPFIRARIRKLQHNQAPASTLQPSRESAVPSVGSSRKPSREESEVDTGAAGRGTLRVSAERLDRLMDLIGELVVHRSQQRTTVASLSRLQKLLKKSRQRLFATIDGFRERYEFHGLAGKRRARANASASKDLGFSDLELDHYEDVNILARSLEEVDSDIAQLQAQIDGEMEAFNSAADGFGALVSSLQGEITEARMVAVDQLFLRLRRPIRDAAERLGKDVRVVTTGDDVTLDKTIIDQLYAPMLHLVRNAVAHGIEMRDDRQAAGKEHGGTIWLAARQESGQIVLEVRDDGRGLDVQALHRIGVERGLLPPETPVDDPRVRELVFVSGLSTKKQADAVSGRGVGCDVVRRVIEHLSGVIDVVTEEGRGTTFRITMPLTLAIYRALLVRHAGLTFALPISFSERILDADEAEIFESTGVRRLRLDDQFLEVRDLSQMLGMPVESGPGRLTVVLRLGPDRIAVHIDEILGQDEIVVKSLGDVLTGHQMFSGVTVDGEGNLILILDVTGLFHTSGRVGGRRAASEGHVAAPDVAKAAPAASRRVRVLYADDSLSVRKAAEKFLGDVGADLVLAVDGVDALDKLRTQPFDMVFTDLEMPRMHGFELLREMRYVPAFKDVPVVVVTSRSGDKHRQQAEKLGCNGYLTKPFTPAALQEQIVKLTGAVAGGGGLMVEHAEVAR